MYLQNNVTFTGGEKTLNGIQCKKILFQCWSIDTDVWSQFEEHLPNSNCQKVKNCCYEGSRSLGLYE